MKKTLIFLISITISTISFGQNLDELDSYRVDEFYKKVELDYGTLDEDGDEIEYVYVKFNNYFGYAGYSTECIMKVDYYSATVYKLE